MTVPTHRQVEVSSDLTLAGLHEIIQVLFGWDGDHLYQFVIGRHRYGDPYLDDWRDDDVALAVVAGRAGKVITYSYDLGACWEHRIVVDAVDTVAAAVRYPRCLAVAGPHPAEYDGQRPRAADLSMLNKRLARAPRPAAAPGRRPGRPAATPEVATLATAARESSLLQDLVRLARWAATPRAVTATGALRKPEVPGALEVLGLPAAPAGFRTARNLPAPDAAWRLAEDLGLVGISGVNAIAGPAVAAWEDDEQILELWTSLWEYAAVDARALLYDGRPLNRPRLTTPLLDRLWHAGGPVAVEELDQDRCDHDRTAFLALLLDQLVPIGGVWRLPDRRYQLAPLGRHGHRAVLDAGFHEPTRC
jgi:hypothetical protein